MAAVAAIGGLVVAGASAAISYSESQKQSQAAQAGVQQQEAAEGATDATLKQQENQNANTQTQDAQWMQMKTMANQLSSSTNQAPSGLLSLQAAQAGSNNQGSTNAGKLR